VLDEETMRRGSAGFSLSISARLHRRIAVAPLGVETRRKGGTRFDVAEGLDQSIGWARPMALPSQIS